MKLFKSDNGERVEVEQSRGLFIHEEWKNNNIDIKNVETNILIIIISRLYI